MNFDRQYFFIKNINRLLNQGYSVLDTLNLLIMIHPKEINLIKSKLAQGTSLAQSFKALKFKPFVYEAVLIGEKSNKINEVLILIEKQYYFYQKIKKLFTKLLLYPLVICFISLICFELIRINLYPLIQSLSKDFFIKNNKILVFIAFHLLKIIGAITISIIVLFTINKSLANIVPIIKNYRLLKIIKYLDVLLTCGYSLDEAIKILETSLNNQIYRIDLLTTILINKTDIKLKLTPFDKSFVLYFKQGIINNDIINALRDYHFIYEDILASQITRTSYYLQFSLFFIIAINILLIYYVIMLPILQISENI